jgi:hypothetical protein
MLQLECWSAASISPNDNWWITMLIFLLTLWDNSVSLFLSVSDSLSFYSSCSSSILLCHLDSLNLSVVLRYDQLDVLTSFRREVRDESSSYSWYSKFWYHCKIFYLKWSFNVHHWFSDEQLHMLEEAFFLELRIKVTKRQ